jgi:hypothetical protein
MVDVSIHIIRVKSVTIEKLYKKRIFVAPRRAIPSSDRYAPTPLFPALARSFPIRSEPVRVEVR